MEECLYCEASTDMQMADKCTGQCSMGNTPVYVIAGSAETAHNYRKHKRIPREKFQYVSRPQHLYGIENVTIIELYDFVENTNYHFIQETIEARNLNVKYDDW